MCATSGVTSRYFYQHFTDRDALLRAVYQQLYATFQEVIVRAIPDVGATPDVLAPAPIRALVMMIESDRRLGRIFLSNRRPSRCYVSCAANSWLVLPTLCCARPERASILPTPRSPWRIWRRCWGWADCSRCCGAGSTTNSTWAPKNWSLTAQVSSEASVPTCCRPIPVRRRRQPLDVAPAVQRQATRRRAAVSGQRHDLTAMVRSRKSATTAVKTSLSSPATM